MAKSKLTSAEESRIVLESLNTNIAAAELCRKYNIRPQTSYSWKEKSVEGGKASLNGTPGGIIPSPQETSRQILRQLELYRRLEGKDQLMERVEWQPKYQGN